MASVTPTTNTSGINDTLYIVIYGLLGAVLLFVIAMISVICVICIKHYASNCMY